jgi:hypothetical protein
MDGSIYDAANDASKLFAFLALHHCVFSVARLSDNYDTVQFEAKN